MYIYRSGRSDFWMIFDVSIVICTFVRRMLTSHSVDKILLSRYVKRCINVRGLLLKMYITLSCSKHKTIFFSKL